MIGGRSQSGLGKSAASNVGPLIPESGSKPPKDPSEVEQFWVI